MTQEIPEYAKRANEILNQAFPIYQQGGFSGAMYRADSPEEADGYVVDIEDWRALRQLFHISEGVE